MGNAYLMQDLKSNVCPVAVSIRIESAMNGIKSQSATTTNDVQSVTAIIALKIIKFMYAEKCSARPATYTTHQIDHVLFKPLRSLKKQKPIRIAVYDFETSQDAELRDGVFEHEVVFVSLRWTCTRCEDIVYDPSCEVCTATYQNCSKSWSWYNSQNPLQDFVHFVIMEFGMSKYETILWAHNGGRFDGHFVLHEIYKIQLEPKLTMTGLKIFDISVKLRGGSNIHFRDSYMVLCTGLDNLKKTFGLNVEEKMFFPYMFCKRENMNKELNYLPPIEDYLPTTMMHEKHEKFLVNIL
jgi:hypothetical protein